MHIALRFFTSPPPRAQPATAALDRSSGTVRPFSGHVDVLTREDLRIRVRPTSPANSSRKTWPSSARVFKARLDGTCVFPSATTMHFLQVAIRLSRLRESHPKCDSTRRRSRFLISNANDRHSRTPVRNAPLPLHAVVDAHFTHRLSSEYAIIVAVNMAPASFKSFAQRREPACLTRPPKTRVKLIKVGAPQTAGGSASIMNITRCDRGRNRLRRTLPAGPTLAHVLPF
ncbi:hypothetical protein EVAR_25356_1 [Eumeta japonica]|uniref:Uncharacterized protein n=1 Tax=Eumeta variegata TaxID=151549 RepID=A0A4C1XXQ2_EUMVA|nr:hypothetical protein EVAR_25356_1 [Eumeta japonica]